MEFDPRLLAFELINFLVLMLILRRFLFRPVRETLQRRREELERRNTELAAREAAARKAEQSYREQLIGLEQEAEHLRGDARRRGREEADQLVEAARAAMDQARLRAEEELAELTQRALVNLRPQLLDIALEAALRVAKRLSSDELVADYALEAARAVQRDAPSDAVVEVRHSPEADPERLEAALREIFGTAREVTLHADPEVIAGVRLQAGDLEVEASAGASLDDWARELRSAA